MKIESALTELAILTGRELDASTIAAYCRRLGDYPANAVLAAIDALARKSTFFPSLGQIVEAMGNTDAQIAAAAWTEALNRASSGRERRAINCPPDIAEAVRLVGGWDVIAATRTDKLPFIERRFCEIYTPTRAKIATLSVPVDRVSFADFAAVQR